MPDLVYPPWGVRREGASRFLPPLILNFSEETDIVGDLMNLDRAASMWWRMQTLSFIITVDANISLAGNITGSDLQETLILTYPTNVVEKFLCPLADEDIALSEEDDWTDFNSSSIPDFPPLSSSSTIYPKGIRNAINGPISLLRKSGSDEGWGLMGSGIDDILIEVDNFVDLGGDGVRHSVSLDTVLGVIPNKLLSIPVSMADESSTDYRINTKLINIAPSDSGDFDGTITQEDISITPIEGLTIETRAEGTVFVDGDPYNWVSDVFVEVRPVISLI